MIKQGKRDLSTDQVAKLIEQFEKIKAEQDDLLDSDHVFVRTGAFAKLIERQKTRRNTVLLGRKGDGKTALLRRLAREIKQSGSTPSASRQQEILRQIDMEESYFAELMGKF